MPSRKRPPTDPRTDRDISPDGSQDAVCGPHAVLEILRSESVRLQKIYVAYGKKSKAIGQIRSLARGSGVPVAEKEPAALDRMVPGMIHQGVVGRVRPFEPAFPEDMLALAARRGEQPLLLVLDQIHDPQNVGSLIRTANGAGAHGVILSARHTSPVTPAVSRASAGAVEHTLIAQVSGLAATLDALKKTGLWIFGTDPAAQSTIYEADWSLPAAVVVGSEEKGLRPLVRRTCDALFRIPMYGRVAALNASVSAAVVLFEARRQRAQRSGADPSD